MSSGHPIDVERAGFDSLARDRAAQATLDAVNAAARQERRFVEHGPEMLDLLKRLQQSFAMMADRGKLREIRKLIRRVEGRS